MKFILLLCLTVILLPGCGFDFGTQPVPGPDAETVKLVLYYSDGEFDTKGVGEMMLISTSEILHVKRNRIRPDSRYIVHDFNKFEAPPQDGFVALKLDRKNGIACLANKCTELYAICPSMKEMRRGEKCVSFSRK
jgi:hypothetical protein